MERYQLIELVNGLEKVYHSSSPIVEVSRETIKELFKDTSAHGPTREQVEKAWRGEWIDKSILSDTPVECSKCGEWIYGHLQYTNFCPHCGAPMTDEAVEIMIERLSGIK